LDFGFWILDRALYEGLSRVRSVNEQEFKQRTKRLALRYIQLVGVLPRQLSTDVIGRQLVRCSTSVGANYRSACRAKSTADLISKLSIVKEEADECLY
jgi:four helix bundle protein